jgi:hypothetical protein
MGRTAETKVNLESARDLTMLIFPIQSQVSGGPHVKAFF